MSVALWLLALGVLVLPGRRPGGHRRDREPTTASRRGGREVDGLPAVLDLAAAALRAGAPPGIALGAAAGAAGPELAPVVREVAGLLSLGVDPAAAWSAAAGHPGLATVAVLGARSGTSGARLAEAFAAAAAEVRADAVTDARRAAARVGVWAVLPLGLCYLPAFVCVGVVPAVAGLATGLTLAR